MQGEILLTLDKIPMKKQQRVSFPLLINNQG